MGFKLKENEDQKIPQVRPEMGLAQFSHSWSLPNLYSVYIAKPEVSGEVMNDKSFILQIVKKKKTFTHTLGFSVCTGKKKIKKTRHAPPHTLTRQHYNCRSAERGTKIKYLNRSWGRTTQCLALDCFVKKNIWISWCIINLKSCWFILWRKR
jgi:hypothetical protein